MSIKNHSDFALISDALDLAYIQLFELAELNPFERGGRGVMTENKFETPTSIFKKSKSKTPSKPSSPHPSLTLPYILSRLPDPPSAQIEAMLTLAECQVYTSFMPLPIGTQKNLALDRANHSKFILREASVIRQAGSLTQAYLSPSFQETALPYFKQCSRFLDSDHKKVIASDATTYSFQEWANLHRV